MAPARRVVHIAAGTTIEQVVRSVVDSDWQFDDAYVRVDGYEVERGVWSTMQPGPGSTVAVTIVPKNGQDFMRAALIIGLVTAAAFAGPAVAGALALPLTGAGGIAVAVGVTAAVTMLGMLAINAIIPPATADVNDRDRDSPAYAISGTRNEVRKFSVVPMVFGEVRFHGPIGATPTFDVVDDDLYFRTVVIWGEGPIDIDRLGLKIGTTPIEEFDDVEVEHFAGAADEAPDFELYKNSVRELAGGGELTVEGGQVVRETASGINAFTVEIVAPRGLIRYAKSSSQVDAKSVTHRIESRKVGDVTWTDHGDVTMNHQSTNPVRRTYTFETTDQAYEGPWEVAVTRITANSNEQRIVDDTTWTVLRTMTARPPINLPGCAASAVRMRSTGQLSGVTDQMTALVAPLVLDYDFEAEEWVTRSSANPAACFVRALQHPWGDLQVPDAEIDWASVEEWHDYCRVRDLRFDYVFDYKATAYEMLDLITKAGDAVWSISNGKWKVYIDGEKPDIVQTFTPRNANNFATRILYYQQPHAIRVAFQNSDIDFEADEIIVPAEGYTEETAEIIETLELPGKVRADEIQRRVRRRFAEAIFRDRQITFTTDIAGIVCEKLDRILVVHDAILAGVGSGRVVGTTVFGSTITEVILDAAITMESGRSYAMALQSPVNEAVVLWRLVTLAGRQTTLVLQSPVGFVEAPDPDDMVAVVEINDEDKPITTDCIISQIEPQDDLGVQITAVPYREEILTPDTEPVPEWTSKLTLPPGTLRPIIIGIYSSEMNATRLPSGDVVIRASVVLHSNATEALSRATGVAVRWRDLSEGSGWTTVRAPFDARTVSLDGVIAGRTIEVQANYELGTSSGPWTSALEHTVEGLILPPEDVEAVWQDGDVMRWETEIGVDHAGWLLRTANEVDMPWSAATPAHAGVYTGDVISIELLPEAAVELLAKAVTIGGVESVEAARGAIGTRQSRRYYPMVVANRREQMWPGTISGGETEDGDLVAVAGSSLWPDGTAAAWPDGEGPAFDISWSPLEYETEYVVPEEATELDVIEIYMDADNVDMTVRWGSGVPVVFADEEPFEDVLDNDDLPPDDNLPFGGLWEAIGNSPARPYRGPIRPVLGGTLVVRVVGSGGGLRPRVRELRISLTAPEITYTFQNQAIPVEGVRLPPAQPLRLLVRVLATLNDDSDALTVRASDKSDPVAGPLVKAYDATNTATAANADVAVTGV